MDREMFKYLCIQVLWIVVRLTKFPAEVASLYEIISSNSESIWILTTALLKEEAKH